MTEPTRKQKLLIQAIYFLAKDANGRPPSFREVAERLGLRSTDGITSGLLRLERAGWLVRDHGSPRSMWITVEGELAAGLRVVEEPKDDYEGEDPPWDSFNFQPSYERIPVTADDLRQFERIKKLQEQNRAKRG